MNRFKRGISFSIVLAGILAGLSAAILHPYVHALQTSEYSHSHPGETSGQDQEFSHIDSADNCYICTISQKLTYGDTANTGLKLTLKSDRSSPFPFFYYDDGFDPVIFLRGPPFV